MRELIIMILSEEGMSARAFELLRQLAEYSSDYGINLDDIIEKSRFTADFRYELPRDHGLK
jgi:hypothetical protein